MPDRRSSPWPLLAISLLVFLLAAFLVLRFRRQAEEKAQPVVVKEPARPAVVVPDLPLVKPPDPVVPVPPDVPPPDPAPAKVVDDPLTDIRKALKERRWDVAEKLLAALKSDAPGIDVLRLELAAGRLVEETARQEALAREEAKRVRDQDWQAARDQADKAKDVNRWDEAMGIFDALLKKHPDLVKVEDIFNARKNLGEMRDESNGIYTKDMAEAEKFFQAGRYAQASTTAAKAVRLYPERTDAVRAFQEKVAAAKIDSEMIRIPSSTSWVGSDANPDEMPVRQIKLPSFYLDRYEVTNEDYQAFIVAGGHPAPPHWAGKSVPKGRERHPVVYVSHEDATAYARWSGKRLPSAEEWEVAARGPDRREFPWGNAFSDKDTVFPCNSLEYWQVQKAVPTTLAVDAPALANGESAFRVHGMGGNVWEWTSTASPGKSGEVLLEFRILKGGSFLTPARALRCANVLPEDPRLGHPDVGFRCARDAK